jgi:uncharacterized protein (DUF2336 family)
MALSDPPVLVSMIRSSLARRRGTVVLRSDLAATVGPVLQAFDAGDPTATRSECAAFLSSTAHHEDVH